MRKAALCEASYSEEPRAVVPHAGICAGAVWQRAVLPRSDIVYFSGDGPRVYYNQSGNAWSAPTLLRGFPPIDNQASVAAVDLFGNGTACLVWSSALPADSGAPMRYVDLMGGQKPHLLTGVRNNLGAETRIHYTSSTHPGGRSRFSLDELRRASAAAQVIPFHHGPRAGQQQLRLLQHGQVYFRRDDLSGPLPLGEIEAHALPFESRRLAFTSEHLAAILGERIDARLLDEGRYLEGEDGSWWIPSGRAYFRVTEAATPADELIEARAHFYLPRRFLDPFGAAASVDYDPYDLLPVWTTDPLANQVSSTAPRPAGIAGPEPYLRPGREYHRDPRPCAAGSLLRQQSGRSPLRLHLGSA